MTTTRHDGVPSAARLTATVLITAHNEAEHIGRLVGICASQPYPLDDIIVVADSCTDDTVAEARRAGATWVVETAFKDKAANQNLVLPYVKSDVVVGFDGDTVPEPDCIEIMMADLASGKDATCATLLPIQDRGLFVNARRFAYALGRRWWRLCQAKVGRMQVLTGAAYAFRTEAIGAVGGFPAGLISADMDATWALHRGGYKLGYAADAIAYTLEPDSFKVYRAQMRRWSSGYFQNMAKYRRELTSWRSMLVVGTALFDLLSMFIWYGVAAYMVATGGHVAVGSIALWLGVHLVVNVALVASVVGLRKALRGLVPYLLVNYYNKWLYLCAFGREWILGRHYQSWTGRQGRKTQITPMPANRYFTGAVLVAAAGALFAGFAIPQLASRPSAPASLPAAAAPAEPGPSARESAPPAARVTPEPVAAARFQAPTKPRAATNPPAAARPPRPEPSRAVRTHPEPSKTPVPADPPSSQSAPSPTPDTPEATPTPVPPETP